MLGREFAEHKTPVSDTMHPEMDDSPLLSPADHAKFRSLVGCANWLVTLGRFDIAHAVNALSHFTMQPRQGHLHGMIRLFGCLKKFKKGRIMIDPTHPDHSKCESVDHKNWKEFHPDVEEMMPPKSELPAPLSPRARLTVCVDADWVHDMATRRSVTGTLVFLNKHTSQMDF